MASQNLGCFLRLLPVASRHENGNSTLETKLQVFVQAWAQWNFQISDRVNTCFQEQVVFKANKVRYM